MSCETIVEIIHDLREIVFRVVLSAVYADLEVEVGTRGCSGASDFADLLACGYIVSDRYIDVSCMGIESGDSVAVIYYAVVAVSGSACVAAFDRLGNIDDRARSGSADG
jgi:hypothetical protein